MIPKIKKIKKKRFRKKISEKIRKKNSRKNYSKNQKFEFMDKIKIFRIVCKVVVEKYSQSFEIDLQVINVNSFL